MIDPKTVLSPKDQLTNLKVIYDGGELQAGQPFSGWSLAEFDWNESPAIGIRWNGEEDGVGTPAAFGRPMWFVLPLPVGQQAQDALYAHLYRRALAVAEVKEVEVA
jgi:hypothetical protein